MRTIRYIFPIAALAVMAVSCDDYLDVKPVGKMIPTEVSQYENLLNNTLTIQYFMSDNNHDCAYAMLGDNAMLSYNHAHYQYTPSSYILDMLAGYVFYDRLVNPSTTPFYWTRGMFTPIAYFNNVIDGIVELGADDEYARGVVAQAKAGRAWVYMNGALTYGPMYDPDGDNDTPVLPLRTSGDPMVANGPLATTRQIFDQVKQDLDYACAYCPEYTPNAARATRAAAYAIRAEYHMYMRNWTEMLADAQEAWKLAKAAKGSEDDLIYDFNDFYYESVSSVNPAAGVDPKYYMTLRGPDTEFAQTENRENLLFRSPGYGDSRTRFYPSDDFLSIFDRSNDKRWDLFALDYLGYSVTVGGEKLDDGVHTQYFREMLTSVTEGITHPLLLLTKAEAEARTGALTEALESLNTLRRYRYMGTDTDLPGGALLNQDQLLNEILTERRREQHNMSFHRVVDLKRYAFDSGKPWRKDVIVHKIGDKEYSASIDSDVFQSINIDNAILRYNPQWGIPVDESSYAPYSLL